MCEGDAIHREILSAAVEERHPERDPTFRAQSSEGGAFEPERLAHESLEPVAADCVCGASGNNEPREHVSLCCLPRLINTAQDPTVEAPTRREQFIERDPSAQSFVASHRRIRRADYRSSLMVSFLRPRALRRARTFRPFFVAMRARKPWVFFRFLLWG